MSDNIITIKHLKKHYQALPVLLDINLEVNRGDVISIIVAILGYLTVILIKGDKQ